MNNIPSNIELSSFGGGIALKVAAFSGNPSPAIPSKCPVVEGFSILSSRTDGLCRLSYPGVCAPPAHGRVNIGTAPQSPRGWVDGLGYTAQGGSGSKIYRRLLSSESEQSRNILTAYCNPARRRLTENGGA